MRELAIHILFKIGKAKKAGDNLKKIFFFYNFEFIFETKKK